MWKRLAFIVFTILLLSVVAATSSLSEASAKEQQNGGGGVTIKNDEDGGDDDNDGTAIILDEADELLSVDSTTTATADAAAIDNTNNQQEHEEDDKETILNIKSSPHQHQPHEPPSHFQITAHIQTNLHTGLSYFLPPESLQYKSSYAHIPFLECGAIGSTTASVPLTNGVFRHVPPVITTPLDEKEKMKRGGLEYLEERGGDDDNKGINNVGADDENLQDDVFFPTDDDDGEGSTSAGNDKQKDKNGRASSPKRPSPPTYVVALSPLEITVGGNGNETQRFDAGDVIFFEDTWLGIWDEIDMMMIDSSTYGEMLLDDEEQKMKGYTMRASPESRIDLNVIILTIPPALHRQWKYRHQRQQKQQQQKQEAEMSNNNNNNNMSNNLLNDKTNNSQKTAPWWKLSSRIIKQQTDVLPKPCSLESDPAFAHPSVSVPTSLSQHFSQHFTKLLRQFHQQPFHLSSLSSVSSSHGDYDLILPILAQTTAAAVGSATAFAGVLHLLRTVNPTVAIGFGAACVIGFGTWGIVWLGEELLDEWEMWRERRRLERRMSESLGI